VFDQNNNKSEEIQIEYDTDIEHPSPSRRRAPVPQPASYMGSDFECSETECDQQMICDKIHDSIDKIEEDLRQSSLSDFDTELVETKIRTNRSIHSFRNEFIRKIQFPFLVEALFSDLKNMNHLTSANILSFLPLFFRARWAKTAG
jgi:hypothetical protein